MGIKNRPYQLLMNLITTQNLGLNGLKMCELGNQIMKNVVGVLPLLSAKDHFTSLGIEHTSIDLNGRDGALPLDLAALINEPDLVGHFDVLTNFGTSEHVKDQYECFRNIHRLVRPGGVVIHVVPPDPCGDVHGLYNYPQDFFTQLCNVCEYELINIELVTWKPIAKLIYVAYKKIYDNRFPSRAKFDSIPIKKVCKRGHIRDTTMQSLDDLASKYETDKGCIRTHNSPKCYTKYYSQWLEPIRNKPLSLLEIGVYSGASLRMWKEYLPKANIYGIDIRPTCKNKEEDRIKIYIGNQQDKQFLTQVVEQIGIIDIIIDDGGHRTKLQIASFEVLFPHVASGGLYIIEDLYATVRLDRKEGCKENNIVDQLSQWANNLMIDTKHTGIESISFYRPETTGALVFIQKR